MKKSGCVKVAFLRKQLLDNSNKIYLFTLDVFNHFFLQNNAEFTVVNE